MDRHLKSVQKALEEREKRSSSMLLVLLVMLIQYNRHGATVEEMTIEVNKAKKKLESAEKDHRQMSKLNKVSAFPS